VEERKKAARRFEREKKNPVGSPLFFYGNFMREDSKRVEGKKWLQTAENSTRTSIKSYKKGEFVRLWRGKGGEKKDLRLAGRKGRTLVEEKSPYSRGTRSFLQEAGEVAESRTRKGSRPFAEVLRHQVQKEKETNQNRVGGRA